MFEVNFYVIQPSGRPGSRIASYSRRAQERFETVVKRATIGIQRESMLIVPVRTGLLRGSCRSTFTGSGINTTGRVSYSARYAIYVHENLRIRHPNHVHRGKAYNCGGQAKFLQRPARAAAPTIREAMRRALRLR